MTNEIAKKEKQEMSIETLIGQAIDKNVSVETMERLLAMRKELKAERAKEAFDQAMADFQAECPVIEKKKKVDFTSKRTGSRTNYSYAPLDEIVRQVKKIISKNNLSYTIETENTTEKVVSIVKVKHILGHTETTRFEVPIDKESYMSAQQQYGAASTFGKRYAFCNAFGILTGDEDTDAVDEPIASEVKHVERVIDVEEKPAPVSEKKQIALLLSKLGALKKTAKESDAEVLRLTQTEMKRENYPEIIARLTVMVNENA